MGELIRVDFREEHLKRQRARGLKSADRELNTLAFVAPEELDRVFEQMYEETFGPGPRPRY